MKPLLFLFNTKQLQLADLASISHQLFIVKLQAPKLFEIIVKYFLDQGYTSRDLEGIGHRSAMNLIHSVAYCHNKNDNQEFFNIVKAYIKNNMDSFNKFKLIKALDIFKFLENFEDLGIKVQLEKHLELKQEEKLNESEEEELRML